MRACWNLQKEPTTAPPSGGLLFCFEHCSLVCFGVATGGNPHLRTVCLVRDCSLQMNNPYHLWCLWRADVRYARTCITRHNALMDQKVARLIKDPPPEHTIAGGVVGCTPSASAKSEGRVNLGVGWRASEFGASHRWLVQKAHSCS